MRSRTPRIFLRVRELGGAGRLRGGDHVPAARLYEMAAAGPRYGMKTTRSTRRTSHTLRSWAPYV